MAELKKVREFLEDWIKDTKDLMSYVEELIDLSYECKSVQEFEKKAKEIIENADVWHKEELKGIVESALNSR